MRTRLTALLIAAGLAVSPAVCMASEPAPPAGQEAPAGQGEDAEGSMPEDEAAPAEEGTETAAAAAEEAPSGLPDIPDEADTPAEAGRTDEGPAASSGGTGTGEEEVHADETVKEDSLDEFKSAFTGWKDVKGGKSYYKDGKPAKNWLTVSGKTYYFGSDGIMRTGWQTINGFKYYFGSDGVQRTGFQTISGRKYYFFPKTSGKNYKGTMATGWKDIGGKTYCFDSSGIMKTFWQTLNGYTYYFGDDGAQRLGLQKIAGDTYYFYKSTISRYKGHYKGVAATGFVESGGKHYYMQKSGSNKFKAVKGIYHFGDCRDVLDTKEATVEAAYNFFYFTGDGSLYDGAGDSIIKAGNGRYFHIGSGLLHTGFIVRDGRLYYFDKDTAKMHTGWTWAADDQGSLYNGRYAGFENSRGTEAWWYFGSDGALQKKKGWQTISGKKFYFGSYKDSTRKISSMYFDYPMMAAGQAVIDGKAYIFNTKNGLQTGWINGDDMLPRKAQNGGGKGSRYYADSNGVIKTGWVKIDGKSYYFAPSANVYGYKGQLLTGNNIYKQGTGYSYMFKVEYYKTVNGTAQYKAKIGNTWYIINKDGSLVKKL